MTIEIPENQKTLKELRARHGYSQREVAEKIQMSPANYAKIESSYDYLRKSKIDILVKLANLYKISKDEIFLG